MLWLKCCQRCGDGDLSENRDMYGTYVTCLQCGHYLKDGENTRFRGSSVLRTGARSRDAITGAPVAVGSVR